ncbi:cytochrome C biogenesis protein [Deferribacter autotrophicus]|uniref:Cytochrome C biogenesis protein n=1 Tax=Deferribacter autotrophicus TaxID=500465 RepID=A0A5A8F6L5_9BACT|nr:cytochrome c biogenesis protein CcdA [Deferribacter autotrophicus]KAA0258889.1 cytochrome C biogenesis protein [Deferribacter autotrophicus]
MEKINFLTAFVAGILSFLSPCVLPLIPGYMSFISGESIESLTSNEKMSPRAKAIIGAMFFGLGFTLVFMILGASATSIGKLINNNRAILEKIAGIVVIVLGLHLLGVIKIKKLLSQKKWNYQKKNYPFFIEAFLLGVAFVFGWTPCIGPILAGILALASQESTITQGVTLLFVYSLGLWIPFLLAAVTLGFVLSAMRKAGKLLVIIEKISGALLVFIGVLILSGSMTTMITYMLKIFPFLGKLNF